MKISLITLHRVFNYGSILQTYASQKVFEDMGCEVEVVDYITEQRTNKRLFFTMPKELKNKPIHKCIYFICKAVSIIIKKSTFGAFFNKYICLTKEKYITAEDIIHNPPIADLYVTGSDQTWNSHYNEGVDKGFFLEYLPQNKKAISFVASFGKSDLEKSEIEITKKYLAKYSAISVREDSAMQIVNNLGYEAVCLIDPTLQLTKADWMKIASKQLIKTRYLILMLLYNEDNGATEIARKIADEKGLKLVKISWEFKKPKLVDKLMTHRTPQDFLSLFAYADFVVTNSFHGLAFAINLNRQFIVVPRKEFNSRIESLLRLTQLEERLVTEEKNLMEISNEIIDYCQVEKILDVERERAKSFILNNLN